MGFYSRVLETDSGWIVRLARTPDAASRHAMECVALPMLAASLRAAIPKPRPALEPSDMVPFGAIAYRRLPGRLMTYEDVTGDGWREFARQLGREVARLHRAHLSSVTIRRFDPGDFRELHAVVSPPLKERLGRDEWAMVDRWWRQFLGDGMLLKWEPVPTHGDIWWGNLLVEEGRLSGILDWEFLSLCDAAWDLGTMKQFGEPFYEESVTEYLRHRTLEEGWEQRADQWWALRVFFGVRFAVERGDEEEWVDSLRKLREGPILG